MQIIKVDQFNRVVSTQTLRVPKVRSTDPDVQTFYLSSESRPGEEYVIQTRAQQTDKDEIVTASNLRGWPNTRPAQTEVEYLCSCPDYTIRRWAKHVNCKHIEVVRAFATRVGSVSVLADLVRQDHLLYSGQDVAIALHGVGRGKR